MTFLLGYFLGIIFKTTLESEIEDQLYSSANSCQGLVRAQSVKGQIPWNWRRNWHSCLSVRVTLLLRMGVCLAIPRSGREGWRRWRIT